jgi:hypothetical protein
MKKEEEIESPPSIYLCVCVDSSGFPYEREREKLSCCQAAVQQLLTVAPAQPSGARVSIGFCAAEQRDGKWKETKEGRKESNDNSLSECQVSL